VRAHALFVLLLHIVVPYNICNMCNMANVLWAAIIAYPSRSSVFSSVFVLNCVLLIFLVFCVVLCLFVLFVLILCRVRPMLPVFLDCLLLIAPSGFSNVCSMLIRLYTTTNICSIQLGIRSLIC
jgi:hypothetical protein